MRRNGQHGFTIIELIITMAVASVVLGLVYQIFISQRRGHALQDEVAEMQQNARIAADDLAREIKNIGNNVDRDNFQPQLLYCGPYELLFNSDRVPGRGPVDPSTSIDSIYSPGTTITTVAATPFLGDAETFLLALSPSGGRHYDLVRKSFWANQSAGPDEVALNLNIQDPGGNAVPLFRYWGDFDLNGINEWWAGGGPVVPPAGAKLDDVVHRVEVQVVAETQSADRIVAASNSGYRQRVMRSNVTPRNLWSCPVIRPAAPAFTVTTADVFGAGSTNYTFHVVNKSQPEEGRTVLFSLSPPGADTVTALAALSGETDVAGNVDATINWADCLTILGPLLTAGGNQVYTLTATIGEPPKLNTPLGTCAPDSTSVQITLTPGDPEKVKVVGPSNDIKTCEALDFFTFSAEASDICDVVVEPDPGLSFALVDGDGNPFSEYDLSPTDFNSNSDSFTVSLAAAPGSGPFGAPQEADGSFSIGVTVGGTGLPGWLDLANVTNLPFQATISPWPPSTLGSLTTNITSLANHTDCPTGPVSDTFEIFDCYQNTIYQLKEGYKVTPAIQTATPGPSDQGMLYSDQNGGAAAWPGVEITAPLAGSLYEVTYQPPSCTLEPPQGNVINPSFSLTLKNPSNTALDTLGPQNFNLEACADCEVLADPVVMTECTGGATITVTGCDLNNQIVEFEVTSNGGDGSFSDVAVVTTTTLTLSGTGPSTASATLYIGNAQDGDILTVTAHYTSPSGSVWSCSPIDIPVSSQCQSLEIYSDAGYTEVVGKEPGQESCLGRLHELYFEVEDCQHLPGTLSKAVIVHARSDSGVATTEDREYVDLDEFPRGTLSPFVFRSTVGLPFEEDNVTRPFDGILTYVPGERVTLWAGYEDPLDPPDSYRITSCWKEVPLTVPLPVCFPNAITSAGGATWNGNFNVHWGDVVIMGNTTQPDLPKFIEKLDAMSGGMFNGSPYLGSRSDRFFDLYVGKASPGATTTGNFVGLANPDPLTIDRPYLPGGYGNYFRNVPHAQILSMIAFLDYDVMKTLAKDRGVYWYTLGSPGSVGNIRNPATGQEADFEVVLGMTGPQILNGYHDGLFIFVDTFGSADPGPARSGASIDSDATADLPVHEIIGDYYTEGIIYLAGSIYFGGMGTTTVLPEAETPPGADQHYDHNVAGWDPNLPGKLPIRADPRQPAATWPLRLHINGAVYIDGEFQGAGNPAIFGSITTERGYTGSGTPEIWYNYNLNVADEEDALCIECCKIEIFPAAVSVAEHDTVALAAWNAAGLPRWVSNDPAIASVDPTTGVVTGHTVGIARIKAVDDNNCVARATVEVTDQCLRFSVAPTNPTIDIGGPPLLFTAMNPPVDPATGTSSVTWTSTAPGIATIVDPLVGFATGVDSGFATIRATDVTGQCPPAETLLKVCALAVDPATAHIAIADSVVLTADNAVGTVNWSTDDPAGAATLSSVTGASITYTPSVEGTFTITAKDDDCVASATITVVTALCTLTVDPASATIGPSGSVNLTASTPTGAVSWVSSDAGIAGVSPALGASTTVTGVSAGTATVTATDSVCSQSATVEVVTCNLSINPAGLPAMPKGTSEVLTANGANGPVSWTSSRAGWVNVIRTSDTTATAEALLKNKTVTITATDSAPAGCTATITINTVAP